jgi:hypothetical protein
MSMEFAALVWLRTQRRCKAVLLERSPRSPYGCRPDVIGLTQGRELIEVEIKRSLSDFRANKKKLHVCNRDMTVKRWPHFYYFLVSQEFVDRAESELPEFAGLMYFTGWDVVVRRKAPKNAEASRLTLKECVQFSALMVNQMISAESRCISLMNRPSGHGSFYWHYEI